MVQTKYCFVRDCDNSSRNSNKFFITVPRCPDKRIKWYHAVNIREEPSKTCNLYCCEDHFDLENDVENWIYYKMMGRKIFLKKDVVPHIFPVKRDESRSQFSEEDKKLKRKLLQDYQTSKFKNEYLGGPTTCSSSFKYSVETSVVDVDKNVLINVKSMENDNIKSQFLVKSMENKRQHNTPIILKKSKPISTEETIIPSHLNIQIDTELPELIWIKNKQQSPEKHQPLLLRRKNKIKKVPEVVWINPPLVEISQEDEVEKTVENAGTVENEQSEANLKEIKSESPLIEIKQEEIEMQNITLEDSTGTYLYLPTQTNEDILLEAESTTTMTIKEEPETEDFEFVNVNSKTESTFFFEDPLKISGRNIYVAQHNNEENILG